MITNRTTDFPNQGEYSSQESFVPFASMLDGLPSLGIVLIGCTATCNATAIGNLSNSGQLLETRITLEIEDEQAVSSVTGVGGRYDQCSFGWLPIPSLVEAWLHPF